MNVFVFDIQTVPDIDGCRRLYDLHGLSDEDVGKAVIHMRRQEVGNDILPHHLHKIVTISAVLQHGEQFKVWSLGDLQSSEEELLSRFFSGIERYTPDLVSWDGRRFDLPVIHYRSLLYPINAGHYWETGDRDSSFRDNNYLAQYHGRHTDLREVLAAYSPQACASLHEVASLCGFPGKTGERGVDAWDKYLQGNIDSIRVYCEIKVLNTYLVYLNYQRNRGVLDQTQYQQQCALTRESLKTSNIEHLQTFENHWIDL